MQTSTRNTWLLEQWRLLRLATDDRNERAKRLLEYENAAMRLMKAKQRVMAAKA